MSWPLTGRALADFNRMLNDWKQYSTFPFIGPDDIDRLYNVLLAAGLRPQLEDVGNRPQYWLLQLVSQAGNSGGNGNLTELTITSNVLDNVLVIRGLPDIQTINLVNATVVDDLDFTDCENLDSVLAPNLVTTENGLYFYVNPLLTTINVPALTDMGTNFSEFEADRNASLTSINLPQVINIGQISCGTVYGGPASPIVVFNAPNMVPQNGSLLDFAGCSLNQTSVDLILSRAVANPGYVTGTINLQGGANSSPSSIAPGSDYDILVNRGVTVNVN